MGRGRAKAKQTKVARALKYHSPDTDLVALQRELGGRASDPDQEHDQFDDDVDEVDDEDEDDEDGADDDGAGEDGNWAARRAR
jgi:hypothetical protein